MDEKVRLIFITISILIIIGCKSKVKHPDTHYSKTDSIQIAQLLQNEMEYEVSKPDSALILLTQVRNLAIRDFDTETIFHSYSYASAIYASIGAFQKSKIASDSAMYWATRNEENKPLLMAAYSNYGNLYKHQNQIDSAIIYYIKAYDLLDSNSPPTHVAVLSNNLGILLGIQGNNSQALRYLHKSEDVFVKQHDTANLFSVYQNITRNITLNSANDSLQLKSYLNKLLSIYSADNGKFANSITATFVGGAYVQAGLIDSAIFMYKASLAMAKTDHQVDAITTASSNLGELFTDKGMNDSAFKYYSIYRSVCNPDSAVLQQRLNYYNTFYLKYKKTGKIPEALLALEKLHQASNETFQEGKKEQLLKHEREITRLKAEKLIAAEENQINRQRFYVTLLIAFAILIILVAALIWMKQRATLNRTQQQNEIAAIRARKKEEEMRAEMLQKEIAALFAQLNPHFIFNALNPLALFMSRNQHEEGLAYLGQLSILMRSFVNLSQMHFAPIQDVLTFLEHYVQIQQQRFSFVLDYVVDTMGVDIKKYGIPALMLQPIIENAIEYGVGHTGGGTITITINISFLNEQEVLQIIISNTGALLPPDFVPKSGHALSIIAAQVNILKQQHGLGNMTIQNLPDKSGIQIVLDLPLIGLTI